MHLRRAYVALADNNAVTMVELQSFLNGKLAIYEIPEAILVLDELPKGLTGKINRRALRERCVTPS